MTLEFEENNFLETGDIFAQHYRIIEKCKSIAKGQAYKAEDTKSGKLVIVKILCLKQPIDPVSRTRFYHKTGIACSFKHPNIIPLHNAGILENKTLYIVEDYIEDCREYQTLALCINNDKQDHLTTCWQEGVPIFRGVCLALDHAHKRGLIHRDLNPRNIIVSLDDKGELFAKVTNFSIPPFIGILPNEKTSFGDQQVFSDPAYMSPEQCRGIKADHLSDIYSLGCIMYEAFYGTPPIKGSNDLATIYMHVNNWPILPPEIISYPPLPKYIEAIVVRCLDKEPRRRFPSAKAVLKELDCFCEWEKIRTSQPKWLRQLSQLVAH